jgi:hypothetical protein
LTLIRKIMRRVKGASWVSDPNEENNEESYGSFPLRSLCLSSRGVDLLLSRGVSSPPTAGPWARSFT